MIKGATSVAAVAAIGNFLQGWDGGAIAGMTCYSLYFMMKRVLRSEQCLGFQEIYSDGILHFTYTFDV